MQNKATHEPTQSRVELYAFPKGMFMWPLVLMWPLLFLLSHLGASPEVLGWCHWTVMALVILTLTVNINLKKALVLLLILSLFIVLAILSQTKGYPVFAPLHRFFKIFQLRFDAGVVGLWSIFAGVICLIGYFVGCPKVASRVQFL